MAATVTNTATTLTSTTATITSISPILNEKQERQISLFLTQTLRFVLRFAFPKVPDRGSTGLFCSFVLFVRKQTKGVDRRILPAKKATPSVNPETNKVIGF